MKEEENKLWEKGKHRCSVSDGFSAEKENEIDASDAPWITANIVQLTQIIAAFFGAIWASLPLLQK